MSLSNELISQFAKLTKDNSKQTKKETYIYGTVVDNNGSIFVRLDGSDILTPVTGIVDAQNGDRVMVTIENHTATIMGNYTYPPSQRDTIKAQETADEAKAEAGSAHEQALDALEDATNAKNAADTASQLATTAKEMADSAVQSSADAQALAGEASTKVDTVEQNLIDMENVLNEVDIKTSTAVEAAQSANEKATQASEAAQAAQENAVSANEAATAAQQTADLAATNASTAINTADEAKGQAASAQASVQLIRDDVATSQAEIAALSTSLDTLSNTMEADYARKTDLSETTASLQTQITQNAAQIQSTATKVTEVNETVGKAASDAQAAAQAAQETANQAQAQANQASISAAQAQAEATQAAQAATNAQNEANTAKQAAATAQAKADEAAENLAEAQANLESVQNRVDATEDEIAAAQSAVNTAQQAADKAQSDANAAATAASTAQSKANEAATAASNAQTKANEAAQAAATAQQTANTAAQTASTAQSTANTAAANAQTAQTKANEAAAAATNAQKAADDADAKAAQAASDLATAQQNLANVTSRVDATEEEIEAAQQAVTNAQTAADKAKEDAVTAQQTADKAKSDAAEAQSAADAAQSAADEAQQAADEAKIAADKAQADADALAIRVTTAETQITQNAEAISLRATKTELSTAINDISVGGRNLYTGTKDFSGDKWANIGAWVNSGLTDSIGNVVYKKDSPWGGIYQKIPAKTGDIVTLSANVRTDAGKKNAIFYITEMDPETGAQKYGAQLTVNSVGTSEKRIQDTWVVTTNCLLSIRIENSVSGSGDYLYISSLKLEKGNKATDWTPAPEDQDAATQEVADNLASNYYNRTQTDAQIEVKAEQILSTVSTTYQTLDDMGNYSTTAQMNSAINQKAGEITSTVASTYATKDAMSALRLDVSRQTFNLTVDKKPYKGQDSVITVKTTELSNTNNVWEVTGRSFPKGTTSITIDDTWFDDTSLELLTNCTSARLRAICSANGYMVATGVSNAALYSTDGGVTWTTITGISGVIIGIAYGNGKWIMASTDTIYSANTPNGTWTPVSNGYTALEGVVYGNGVFIAFGDGMYCSEDGIAFTPISNGITATIYAVAYNGKTFIGVGADGIIVRSDDGRTWTNVSDPNFAVTQRAVGYVGGCWCSGGTGGVMRYSSDGINWNEATVKRTTTTSISHMRAIPTSDEVLRAYAVCYDSTGKGLLLESTDGKTWIEVASVNYRLWACVIESGKFYAAGDSGSIYRMNIGVKNIKVRVTNSGHVANCTITAIIDGDNALSEFAYDAANAAYDKASTVETNVITNYATKSEVNQTAENIRSEVSSTYQTKDAMSGYPTTTQMQSAINLKAESILSTVSSTYQTKDAMSGYSTTAQMNSAIEQKANEINLAVSTNYAAKADLTSLDTKVNGQAELISNHESRISVNEGAITSKVSSTDFNNYKTTVTNSINDAKTSAINTAASDATTKANNALTSANSYTDGELSSVTTEITNVKNTVSSHTTSLTGITSRVESAESNITSINGDISSLSSRMSTAEQKITADAIISTVSGTYATKTELNKKANDYTIEIYNGTGGNPKPVKFATVNYSTCNSENGVCIKISMVSGHGNGTSYAFLQDATIRVNHTGGVEVDNVKHYGANTGNYDGAVRQYGDIFWIIDTDNKIVDFYCLMGQYARVYQTPWKRLTYSTGGTVTQYTSCTVYSSGTKVWANNSDVALMTDITELSNDIAANYSTKTEVSQTADSIRSEVSASYQTKDAMSAYSTTAQMNSAIDQKANVITSSVSSTYATIAALSATDTKAQNAQNAIDTLSIGGRNLLRNSNFANGITDWMPVSVNAVSVADSKFGTCLRMSSSAVGDANHRIYHDTSKFTHVSGEEYALSFWAKADSAVTVQTNVGGASNVANHSITTSWQKFTKIYTATSGGSITFWINAANVNVYISNIKMEYGNKVTDWTPAPEDVATVVELNTKISQTDKKITAQASEISSLGSRISTVELTASGLTARIDTTDSNLSTVQTTANTANNTANSVQTNLANNYTPKKLPDTRSVNQTPAWYITNYPQQIITEFKECQVMGLSGSYCTVTTTVPWVNNSGGFPKQNAKCGVREYWREGTSDTTWSAWVDASATATNYMNLSTAGLVVGDMTASTLGNNVLIASDSVHIRYGEDTLSKFAADGIYLGASKVANVPSLAYIRNESTVDGVDIMSMSTEHIMKFSAKGGIYHNVMVDNASRFATAYHNMEVWDPLNGAFDGLFSVPKISMYIEGGGYTNGSREIEYMSNIEVNGPATCISSENANHGNPFRSYIVTYSGGVGNVLEPDFVTEYGYGETSGIRIYSDLDIELIAPYGEINMYGDIYMCGPVAVTDTLDVYDDLSVGTTTSGTLTAKYLSYFKNHMYLNNGKMIYSYDTAGTARSLLLMNSSDRTVLGHGGYDGNVGGTYIYSYDHARVISKTGTLLVNSEKVATQTWTSGTISAIAATSDAVWDCMYNTTFDIAVLRAYFKYTPTADKTAGTAITVGYVPEEARPDRRTPITVYANSTNARRWMGEIQTDGNIVLRSSGALTANTGYDLYINALYKMNLS